MSAGRQQEVTISLVHNDSTGYVCKCAGCSGGVASDPFDSGSAAGASGNKPVWDLTQITSNLTRSNAEWSGGTVSYSFFNSAPAGYTGEGAGFSSFNAVQRTAAREAMQLWDDVAAISFVETNDASGDIRFANTTTGPGVAWAYYPGGGRGGDIWVNPNYYHNGQLNPDDYGYLTMIHEVGHALGLSHPGDYNAGSGNPITYANSAEYAQDTREFTVMSYFNASYSGADHVNGGSKFGATPLLHDIAAIQSIYGVDTTTRTGDTVYGFNSNAGRDAFDFTINNTPVVAIWDAGGNDTLDFSGYTSYYATATIDLNEGAFSDTPNMTNNIAIAYGAKIENAVGGAWHDQIVGNALNNVLDGGAGDDTILGNAGNDSLLGGAGNDSLFGGNGDDSLFGGTGNDWFQGDLGTDRVIYGGNSSDYSFVKDQYGIITIVDLNLADGNDGTDRVDASVEWLNYLDQQILTASITAAPWSDLVITGSSASNYLEGNSGNDTLWGYAGDDQLYGLIGNDSLIGGQGNDYIAGGDGNDTAVFEGLRKDYWITFDGANVATVRYQGKNSAHTGTDRVAADVESFAFADGTWAVGGLPANVAPDLYIQAKSKGGNLYGGAGDDTLMGLGGNDNLYGGDGSDILNAREGNNRAYGGNGNDLLMSRGGRDTLYGDAGSDFISTGGGDDWAYGGSGNDYINAGSGNDRAYGGSGDDTLVGGGGNDSLYGEDSNDFLNAGGGNDFVDGGDGNDVIFTGSGNDRISGGNGDDFIFAGGGNDVISSGEGTNTIFAGSGEDRFYGGNGRDVVFAGGGADRVYSGNDNDVVFAGGNDDRVYAGYGDDTVFGSGGRDTIDGSVGNDYLHGGGGEDRIDGGAGNDTLIGGGGRDRLSGGAGDDTYVIDRLDIISESFGQGNDTVEVGFSYSLNNNFENLTLTGAGNISGTGNAADNVLTGNAGSNFLSGGSGSDTLIGGLGNDVLSGGSEADVFFFSLLVNPGIDTVTDFNRSEDVLRFSDVLDGPGNDVADLDAALFGGGGSIYNHGAGGDVWVNFSGGTLVLSGLGSGAAGVVGSIGDLVDDPANQISVV